MRFMSKTAGYIIWTQKRNENILNKLQVTLVLDFLIESIHKWKTHVERMSTSGWPTNLLTP